MVVSSVSDANPLARTPEVRIPSRLKPRCPVVDCVDDAGAGRLATVPHLRGAGLAPEVDWMAWPVSRRSRAEGCQGTWRTSRSFFLECRVHVPDIDRTCWPVFDDAPARPSSSHLPVVSEIGRYSEEFQRLWRDRHDGCPGPMSDSTCRTSEYSGFFVPVLAQSSRCFYSAFCLQCPPPRHTVRDFEERSPYAKPLSRSGTLPRGGESESPRAARRLSTSVSTRLTKTGRDRAERLDRLTMADARFERTQIGLGHSQVMLNREQKVTLILIPAERQRSIASQPSRCPDLDHHIEAGSRLPQPAG